MLSERDRESLREIEARLRESDGDFVRVFDILTRVGGQRPPSRKRPPRPAADGPSTGRPRPVPRSRATQQPPTAEAARAVPRRMPAPAPSGPSPLRPVQWILGAAVALPVLVIALASRADDAATLALAAVFGATLGLSGYLAAAAVRARRR